MIIGGGGSVDIIANVIAARIAAVVGVFIGCHFFLLTILGQTLILPK